MTSIPYRTALIVGAGSGISASVARDLAAAGLKVGLAARTSTSSHCWPVRSGLSGSPSTLPSQRR